MKLLIKDPVEAQGSPEEIAKFYLDLCAIAERNNLAKLYEQIMQIENGDINEHQAGI